MVNVREWLYQTPYQHFTIKVASADASFRKYYRLTHGQSTLLLMDASLEKDSLQPFLDVTHKLQNANVHAPRVLEQNLEKGYLIIEDFGSIHYLDILKADNFEQLYKKAIDVIVEMQKASTKELPPYDKEFLIHEMDLMLEWYIKKLLPADPSEETQHIIKTTIETIAEEALKQPQGLFVHRDFHSRNLMLTQNGEVGVIDYQDAMNGALCYDIASLLEDSYIEIDRDLRIKLILYFRDQKRLDVDDATMIRWFDFISMQRHIKVLGIFARLYKRDGKDGYLKDIPLTLKYLFDTAKLYEETKPLYKILKEL